MDQKEITLGSTTITLNVKDGKVYRGDLYAKGVELSDDGEPITIELPEQVEWNDEEALECAIREALEIDEQWPDTSDPDWDDNRLLKPDTQMFEVAEFVYKRPLCTSGDIEEALNLDNNVQNVLYSCKKKNLIKTVGREGSSHILAPTHLTFKEMLLYSGEGEDGERMAATEFKITTDDHDGE